MPERVPSDELRNAFGLQKLDEEKIGTKKEGKQRMLALFRKIVANCPSTA
jgi:hypothetical protein